MLMLLKYWIFFLLNVFFLSQENFPPSNKGLENTIYEANLGKTVGKKHLKSTNPLVSLIFEDGSLPPCFPY